MIPKTTIGFAVLKTREPLTAGADVVLHPCFHACLATPPPPLGRHL